MDYLTKDQLKALPKLEADKYLNGLKKLNRFDLWKQPTTYGETTEDLHYRVFTMWYIPLKELNQFDKYLVKTYNSLILINDF